MEINKLTKKIIGCAIEVHKEPGPGLLESTYEQCLAREFKLNKINFEIQESLPIIYKGTKLDCGYRVGFLVENTVIIELKSVDKIFEIHKAQLLTYMKLAKIEIGLLINFNERLLKNGIQRFAL